MVVAIFSEKVIVTTLMKFLSPISFGTLKAAVPDFFRCAIVRNTSVVEFFRQKLHANLIIYFGPTMEGVKFAKHIISWLECGKSKLLTGSFLLNTLNGDDINLCGDIDIITNVYDNYLEYRSIEHIPIGCLKLTKEESERLDIQTQFSNPPAQGYSNDDTLRDLCNISVRITDNCRKKIQLLNIYEDNQIKYIERFDLPICKNYYTCNIRGPYLKVKHVQLILKRRFNLNLSATYLPRVICCNYEFVDLLCNSIYARLCKYKSRSYDILVYTDMNVNNVFINKQFDSKHIFQDLTKITSHVCDNQCVENNGCTIFKLCEYVLKREIIAIWRDFWYNHMDEN
jgi:hypothetical protein